MAVTHRGSRVQVELPLEKLQRMLAIIHEYFNGGLVVCKQSLWTFTGLMAWVTNVCPQVGPFTKMLWAALALQPDQSWIYLKQIVTPLRWLRAFTASRGGPLQRHFRSRSSLTTLSTFDGFPVGGGATFAAGNAKGRFPKRPPDFIPLVD